jgi:flavorubredoxin
MNIKIKNNVLWIGKIDWELRKFHGNEYYTFKGSSYNSYLIREEKNVIVDTVYKPFAKEYIENLIKEIPLNTVNAVVINHAEVDHSGALPELLQHIPDVPVYCSRNGIKSIKGHYHRNWNFIPVKSGDSIDIGNGKLLVFLEMQMLYWPDSMACYLTGDNILFSNDAFGQHYANGHMFNDLVDQCELFNECIKYYANILTPFSPLVEKKINEIFSMNIPIDIIAPSHGVIWRKNPEQIVNKYLEWSKNYQENQVTIVYDSMWGGTRVMAEYIGAGIKEENSTVNIKLLNASITDKNDIITEIFKSKLLILGSPTINKGIMVAIAGIIEEIEGLRFKNKKAVAFGCYGWSGESVQKMNELLKKSGFEIVHEGLRCLWNPDEESLQKCISFGR